MSGFGKLDMAMMDYEPAVERTERTESEGSVKVTIDGRVHLNGALLRYLRDVVSAESQPFHAPEVQAAEPAISFDAAHAAGEFIQHDELDPELYLELTVTGHPDEELPRGMVLLSCGPIAIECPVDELQRALRAFEE